MSSDTSVLYFALMGIIYGGVYIGQVSRHYVAYYACYTGNLCTLVIYGNIVCICTSYVGLRRKWPYVGEKVPYVRKKRNCPLRCSLSVSPQLLCFRHLSESRFLLDALHRRSKFANFCHDLMQNHLS